MCWLKEQEFEIGYERCIETRANIEDESHQRERSVCAQISGSPAVVLE
jgi:hypothetical protein